MNIGLFTDTYFPQLSGVATSIQTLKNSLEADGHSVFIFTTTDPHLGKGTIEPNIFRVSSVPFVSFTDRRIAVRGLFQATKIAKEVKLDIVHTQTEFAMGMIGKYVAHSLDIPAIHTYHTMYEDYLHYVLNGHLLKPYHVKQITKAYLHKMDGVVAPSQRVKETLRRYGVTIPMRSDVGNYYRMADLFVSASDTETQGLTYIEALAAGTKSVVYSTDYTENVFDNKELGCTFKTKDEMKNEILDYLKEDRFTIPENIKKNKFESAVIIGIFIKMQFKINEQLR